MENQELLSQIAQMMESMESRLNDRIGQVESRLNDRIDQVESRLNEKIDRQTQEIKEIIVKNNVAIGEAFEQALEPVSNRMDEMQREIEVLQLNTAQNTMDIAKLKMAR